MMLGGSGILKYHSLQRKISRLQIRLTSTAFKVLDGNFNDSAPRHQDAAKKNAAAFAIYHKLKEQVKAGGGPKSIYRHTKVKKKLLAWDRIKLLLDEDSDTLIIGSLAGLGMDYGDIVTAGGINVIGKVSGQYCAVFASNATVKGGTTFPIGLKASLRVQEIASTNFLPCVNLIDSGGAHLPLQSEIFPDKVGGGRYFRNQAVMQAQNIPQVSVVCGSCTAGSAYIPTMCQEAIMVKGIGYIYLAGPPLVKAATGEVISDDALGGADVHCRVSGCADHLAETESEAYEICRGVLSTVNLPQIDFPSNYNEPLHSESELPNFVGLNDISKEDIYKILSRIVDSSQFQEFKATYGSSLITGFAHIAGILVGVLANCGPVTAKDGLKGAHFVSVCDYRNIPLVFLQYSSPCSSTNDVDELQDGIAVKDKGKMMAAVACSKVPRIAVNIGGCYSDDNYTMSGQSFNPNFLLSWPTALTSMSPLTEQQVVEDSNFSKVESAWDLPPSSAFSCAFNMFVDDIILPQETRKALARCLRIMKYGQISRQVASNHANPIFRM